MNIQVIAVTRHLKQPIWVASYVPNKKEPIWFGWVKKNKKTGRLSYQPGRKPECQSRSGYTPEEALNRLHNYLDAAFLAYLTVWPNAEEGTREGR